jgi:glycosyltransferase involved in cell wall biosynthesis
MINIAAVINTSEFTGGAYHASLTNLSSLSKNNNFNFIFYTFTKSNLKFNIKDINYIRFGFKEKIIYKLRKNLRIQSFFERFKICRPLDYQFEKNNIDLVYFLGPSANCLFLERLNYIMTIWDCCHRDHPEFPEVRNSLEFDARENFYKIALPRATAVIAESPFGKDTLVRRYALDANKVHYIWFSPSSKIVKNEIITSFCPFENAGIPNNSPYIFYPAQFWPHKNHKLIIDTISHLRNEHNISIYAVFCGKDCGNLKKLIYYTEKKGVSDLIKYPGYIPDELMGKYYKSALALVMPSIFGPSNMPPVEAFMFGTPVLVSDLPGIVDQVGDASLFFDPFNTTILAKHILTLIRNPKIREELIAKGKKRLGLISNETDCGVLTNIFNNFEKKKSLWDLDL